MHFSQQIGLSSIPGSEQIINSFGKHSDRRGKLFGTFRNFPEETIVFSEAFRILSRRKVVFFRSAPEEKYQFPDEMVYPSRGWYEPVTFLFGSHAILDACQLRK